jgi:hypothetical protein
LVPICLREGRQRPSTRRRIPQVAEERDVVDEIALVESAAGEDGAREVEGAVAVQVAV